jgi:hypothetical protein
VYGGAVVAYDGMRVSNKNAESQGTIYFGKSISSRYINVSSTSMDLVGAKVEIYNGLRVSGDVSKYGTYGAFYYYADRSPTTGYSQVGPVTAEYSIIALGRIACNGEMDVFSDVRLKKNIEDVDKLDALRFLDRVRVRSFEYKDRAKGISRKVGVIAHEVKEIDSSLVNELTDYVPNIYEMRACVQQEPGLLRVAGIDLKPGTKVCMYTQSKKVHGEVVSNNMVKHDQGSIESENIFVYGWQTDDVQVVAYDQLHNVNIAATQQLFAMVRDLQTENAELRRRLNDVAESNRAPVMRRWWRSWAGDRPGSMSRTVAAAPVAIAAACDVPV